MIWTTTLIFLYIHLTIGVASAQSSGSSSNVTDSMLTCYYCGVRDVCDIPFNAETADTILCEKSCYQFNGYASDSKRIVVRDCGFFHADECVTSYPYEGDPATVGTMCHCMDDECNTGLRITPSKWIFVLTHTGFVFAVLKFLAI